MEMYLEKYPGFLSYISRDFLNKIAETAGNCGAGWRTVTIAPNGNIRPCVLADEKFIVIGNIKKNTITEIMKNPVVECLRNLEWPKDEMCGNCKNKLFCKNCSIRGFVTNEERLGQGLNVCKWAEKYNISKYVNLEPNEDELVKNCLFVKCSSN